MPNLPIHWNSTIGNADIFESNVCYDDDQDNACQEAGGSCDIVTDGYYILCLASAAFGGLWLIWAWRTIKRLQEVDLMEWRVTRSKSITCAGLSDVVITKMANLKC